MTAYGTTQTAIEAMKLGAYDYLLKPFDVAEAQGNRRQRAQGRARHETGRLLRAAARIRGLRTGHRRAQRADAAGLQAHRPGRRHRRHRAHHRRKRHRQGTRRPRDLPSQQPQRSSRFSPSTAPRFPNNCWKANSSATKKARSPARPCSASANSSNATTARFSSMKSAT